MKIEKTLKEVINLLNEHKVRYVIIGAVAVGYYGFPRATHDIDFLVDYNENELQHIFHDAGYIIKKVYPDHTVFQKNRGEIEIDIFFGLFNLPDFDSVYNNKNTTTIKKIKINIISKKDLISSKTLTSRNKDKIDVDELTKGE